MIWAPVDIGLQTNDEELFDVYVLYVEKILADRNKESSFQLIVTPRIIIQEEDEQESVKVGNTESNGGK